MKKLAKLYWQGQCNQWELIERESEEAGEDSMISMAEIELVANEHGHFVTLGQRQDFSIGTSGKDTILSLTP